MKILKSLLILCCLLQPLQAQSWCGYRQVRARSDFNAPIRGARTRMDVVNLGQGDQKAVWLGIPFDNNLFYQVGYTNAFGGRRPAFFAMCFDYSGSPCNLRIIGINPIPMLSSGTVGEFSLRNIEGSTVWELRVNDVPIMAIDFRTANAYAIMVATEQTYSCKAAHFPTVRFYPAIETYQNGGWIAPLYATADDQPYEWGIAGQLQNPQLRINEVLMGSSVANVPPGSLLWQN